MTKKEIWMTFGVETEDHWQELRRFVQSTHLDAADELGVRTYQDGAIPIPNDWAKQVDMVLRRRQKMQKLKELLGSREELDHAFLFTQFPVVQRMQFSKWPAWKVFLSMYMRFNPAARAWYNQVHPAIPQKAALVGLHMAVVFLLHCTWLFFPVPEEDVSVKSRSISEIIADTFDVPVKQEFIIAGVVFHHVADWFRKKYEAKYFYASDIRKLELETLKDHDTKRLLVRQWHDMGTKCMFYCCVWTTVGLCTAVGIASIMPHRRAGSVGQGVLFSIAWGMVAYPLIAALVLGWVVVTATHAGLFDGLISYFPSIIDFQFVDIDTPRFLAWRMVQMERESAVMELIYHPTRAHIQRSPDNEAPKKNALGMEEV
jgi:hypothetical protein